MDTLVATLPVGAGTGAGALKLPPGVRIATGKPKPVATAAEGAENWRFNMSRDGRTMSADEFDAWMAQRKVHVATGRPTPVIRTAVASTGTTSAPAAVATPMPNPAGVTAAVTRTAPATGDGVVLQVASFAARANADRALATLRGAGINGANLHDGTANGKRVWRLRVGPLEAAAANGLASRIAGLGFGTPQPVTE